MNLKAGITVLAAASIGLGLAGCGGSSSSTAPGVMLAPSAGATQEPASAVATTTTPTTTTSTTTTTVSTPKTGALSKEPVIKVPTGAAPKKLEVKTLIPGTGATAQDGDEIYVNYVGALYSNGKVFDASWTDTPGKAFGPIDLGAGAVIKGWDEGLVGLKQGGRYELIIPSSLAYGKAGSGSTIPPNATLVFDVDLLSVSK
jgi:peptidylprolyl isomerase